MKSRKVVTDAHEAPRSILVPDVPKEKEGRNGPSPAEIRQRAFEIHIERGGIYGCDLDDWLEAERQLQLKYGKTDDAGSETK